MKEETQQNQSDKMDEMQYYKKILHSQIENMNDLDILKSIATFVFRISFWRKD